MAGTVVLHPNVSGASGFEDAVDTLGLLGYNVVVSEDQRDADYIIDKRFPGYYSLKGAVEPIFVSHYRELVSIRANENRQQFCTIQEVGTDECWT